MALQFDVESPVDCGTCGKPAVRRTLRILGGGSASFDTHSSCITDKEWFVAINRMNAFFDKLLAFMTKLQPFRGEELEVGKIADFEYRTIHPDACTHREKICIIARVAAFGLETEVETKPRPLKGIRVDTVLKELRSVAGPAALKLKERFDNGRF